MSTQSDAGPIAIAITESLKESLQPVHLEVINESYMHNVPKGSESHFKVLVVGSVVLPSSIQITRRIALSLSFRKHVGPFS